MTHAAVKSLLQLAVDAGAIPAGQVFPKQPREFAAFPALVARKRRKRDRQYDEGGAVLSALVSVDLVVVTDNVGDDLDALSLAADTALEAVEAAVTDRFRGGWVAGDTETVEALWGTSPVFLSTLPVAKRIAA